MEEKVKYIFDDLGEFLGQRKAPVKDMIMDKLKAVYRDLGETLGMTGSPVLRANAFGKQRNMDSSQKLLLHVENSGDGDDGKPPNLNVDSSQKPPATIDFNDSQLSVPDLGEFYPAGGADSDGAADLNSDQKHCKIPKSAPAPVLTTTTTSTSTFARPSATATLQADISIKPTNSTSTSMTPTEFKPTNTNYADEECVVLSDSQWRIIGGYLPPTQDHVKKVTTNITVHPTGGASIASLTCMIFEKKFPVSTACKKLILHVGVKDATAQSGTSATLMKKEITRLIAVTKQTYPSVPEIYLSLIFPLKTGNMAKRADVQVANCIIGAVAVETGVKVFDIAQYLRNGEGIRAHFYENDRHLNHHGAKYLSFRIREFFGFKPGMYANRNGFDPARTGVGFVVHSGRAPRGPGQSNLTIRSSAKRRQGQIPVTHGHTPGPGRMYNNTHPPSNYNLSAQRGPPPRNDWADRERLRAGANPPASAQSNLPGLVSNFRLNSQIPCSNVPTQPSVLPQSNAPPANFNIDQLGLLLNQFSQNILSLFRNGH